MPRGFFDRDAAREEREESISIATSVGWSARNATIWYRKFLTLKKNAKGRKTPLELTFRQYLRLAKKAGLTTPSQVGNKPKKYQLGRVGDTGPYSVRNCRFITFEQNRQEQIENGGNVTGAIKRAGYNKHTRPAIAAMAEAYRGLTKETCERIAITARKKSKNYRVVSPSGKVFRGLNLKSFCEAKGLNQGHMSAVCRGVESNYYGWTGKYI